VPVDVLDVFAALVVPVDFAAFGAAGVALSVVAFLVDFFAAARLVVPWAAAFFWVAAFFAGAFLGARAAFFGEPAGGVASGAVTRAS
jgi:hypothetical protein